MKKDLAYHDFVLYDLMARLPNITSRPMMSGWCIYSDKIPFAAIIENELYIKAKSISVSRQKNNPPSYQLAEKFLKEGWVQFSYMKSNEKCIRMCYWKVPDDIIDNPNLLCEVAEIAIQEASERA